MCGICGVANSDNHAPVNRAVLQHMRDTLVHRGPDDAGLYLDGHVGLGVRRLSIIDVASGHQPLSNEDGSVWIAFNGEIYNYIELRRDYLEGRYHFSTDSDTEVLLHLYERFGEECVHYLNGMFAFAIWDRKKQQLFIARDRFGIKPLYYALQHGTLIFGSEIRSILQHPAVSVDVNPRAIDQFITYGFVQTPETLFSNVYKLPEGHTLTWRRGSASIRSYWDLNFRPVEEGTEEDHVERISQLLTDSIRLRLRSDVPVGLFLSGGIDSSIVAGLAAQSVNKLKTFSIGFDTGKDFNELSYARAVAERFGTDHQELILSEDTFVRFFPRLVSHMEEPVTDPAAIPLYFLSMVASRQVKVVLSGEGSDELFAGYPIYQYMAAIEQYRRIPQPLRQAVFNPVLRALWRSRSTKIDKYIFLSDLPVQRRYLNVNLFDVRLRQNIYDPDFRHTLAGFDAVDAIQPVYQRTEGWDLLSRLLYLDFKTWLPNDILIKADRMSMAASIELRTPFLDYRLAEYAASIPSRFKIRRNKSKYILRRTFRDLVPKLTLRRGKMGFPVPLAAMFRGSHRPFLEETLLDSDSKDTPYLNLKFVRGLLDEQLTGHADHHQTLWRILILRQWRRHFASAASSPGAFAAGAHLFQHS